MAKKCWMCGDEVVESRAGINSIRVVYGELRLVEVNRPYARNLKSKPVYLCQNCMKEKVGMSSDGRNLNPEA